MTITWKYVIKLVDENVFNEFEKQYNVNVPECLRNLILVANAGTPTKIRVRDIDGVERILGALLSYNREDNDNVFEAVQRELHKRYLPFAIDPFGNYFSINTVFGDIIWENHETDEKSHIADSLEEMLQNLY